MKDNQMKQAEREAFEKEFEIIGYPRKLSAWGTDDYVTTHIQQKWEGWQARAKLTTFQVSEPIEFNQWFDSLFSDMREGQVWENYQIKNIANMAWQARTPPTTPQEAISPAIAEYKELAWLVEKDISGVTNYLYCDCIGVLDWTPSNTKAMRFSRKEDADSIVSIVDDADRVAEHMWVD